MYEGQIGKLWTSFRVYFLKDKCLPLSDCSYCTCTLQTFYKVTVILKPLKKQIFQRPIHNFIVTLGHLQSKSASQVDFLWDKWLPYQRFSLYYLQADPSACGKGYVDTVPTHIEVVLRQN